jgi:hypothetical protein
LLLRCNDVGQATARLQLTSREVTDLPVGLIFRNRVKARFEKYFAFPEDKTGCMVTPSRARYQGASRSSRNAARDAMDAGHLD